MRSNDELVDYLSSKGYIHSDRVKKAFNAFDRADFVAERYSDSAYSDRPLPIGEDATISAPHMIAINTELLGAGEDDRVLEIGSGSGYQVAILSELAREVVGVEIEPDLVKKSRKRLEDRKNTRIIQGSGLKPVKGKFDRILYSCSIDSIEDAKEYLREDGVIVAPINRDGSQTLTRWHNGERTEHGPVRFVGFKEKPSD
ncbi:MAG: protein-L-isoaspartate O-methyltransferase [Candidatus Nanohaloarchaea archaeon]